MSYKNLCTQISQIRELLANNLANSKQILTFKETAVFLDIKESYLYQLTSKKSIPHYRPNRKLYFKKSELESWLLQNRQLTTEELKSKAADFIFNNPTLKAKTIWNQVEMN